MILKLIEITFVEKKKKLTFSKYLSTTEWPIDTFPYDNDILYTHQKY